MSEELAPGVFIEEVAFRARTIPGVPVVLSAFAVVLVAFALFRLRRHRGATP